MDERQEPEGTSYEPEAPGVDVPPPAAPTPPPIPEPEGLPEPPTVPDFETPPPPPPPSETPQSTQQSPAPVAPKSRVVAGVLGLLLGSLGIHKFYLGYTNEALIMAGVTIVGGFLTGGLLSWLMSVVGFVEGILYLAKNDAEFDRIYVQGRKPWL